MRRFVLALLLAAGCGSAASPVGDEADFGDEGEFAPASSSGKSDSATPAGGKGSLHRLQVAHGAFPLEGANPNVAIYVPQGFTTNGPIDVVVFLHGQLNCIESVIGAVGKSCNPQKRTPVRTAHNLLAQLDATKKNAVLVVPQLAFDRAVSEAGAFADDDGFRRMLQDAFAAVPTLASVDVDFDLGSVQVISHSGGYRAAAGIARHGGVPITDLVLLDSFYGMEDDFFGWIDEWPYAFYLPRDRRFTVVYTAGAGTMQVAQTQAKRMAELFDADDARAFFLDDRTTATLSDATWQKSLVYKRTGMEHNAMVRYYFGKLVQTSDAHALP